MYCIVPYFLVITNKKLRLLTKSIKNIIARNLDVCDDYIYIKMFVFAMEMLIICSYRTVFYSKNFIPLKPCPLSRIRKNAKKIIGWRWGPKHECYSCADIELSRSTKCVYVGWKSHAQVYHGNHCRFPVR